MTPTTVLLRTAAGVWLATSMLMAGKLMAAKVPDPIVDNKNPSDTRKQAAVLAGGCFW